MQRLAHRMRIQQSVKRIAVKRRQAHHRRCMSGCTESSYQAISSSPPLESRLNLIRQGSVKVIRHPSLALQKRKWMGKQCLLSSKARHNGRKTRPNHRNTCASIRMYFGLECAFRGLIATFIWLLCRAALPFGQRRRFRV
jgi:hypothetical protein